MKATPPPGHLAENVMHFARVLRDAGLPVGTDRIRLALTALPIAGLESRADFHATLLACFVARPEHRALFDQAFHIFWRDPDLLGRIMAMLLPRVKGRDSGVKPPENRRLADALFPNHSPRAAESEAPDKIDIEAAFTFSDREQLKKADFDTMTADEWAAAQRLVGQIALTSERLATRRMQRGASGRLDWRATMKAAARGDSALLRWRRPRLRPVPLVILADISGSMSKYSRMLLHFAHALSSSPRANRRVTSFVFGTRLTPITRALKERDPDVAIAAVVRAVADWSGGTRITACLHAFNADWSRRMLSQNATVLLISDGLEHGDTAALSAETERLSKSCRKLVWLNPLLRYTAFEPRAAGIRAMLPHVDRFLPAHNIESLQQLGRVLAEA